MSNTPFSNSVESIGDRGIDQRMSLGVLLETRTSKKLGE